MLAIILKEREEKTNKKEKKTFDLLVTRELLHIVVNNYLLKPIFHCVVSVAPPEVGDGGTTEDDSLNPPQIIPKSWCKLCTFLRVDVCTLSLSLCGGDLPFEKLLLI